MTAQTTDLRLTREDELFIATRACKGGKCPEPMWCGQEQECLWDRWNPKTEAK